MEKLDKGWNTKNKFDMHRYLGAGKENLIEFQRANGMQLLFHMLAYLAQSFLILLSSETVTLQASSQFTSSQPQLGPNLIGPNTQSQVCSFLILIFKFIFMFMYYYTYILSYIVYDD